jgi:hypothetical protein
MEEALCSPRRAAALREVQAQLGAQGFNACAAPEAAGTPYGTLRPVRQ